MGVLGSLHGDVHLGDRGVFGSMSLGVPRKRPQLSSTSSVR